MRIVNLVILFFSTIAVIGTLRLFARERSSIRSTVMWVFIWILIGLFGMFPDLLEPLRVGAMMQNRMYFLFIVAILTLYAMFFRQSTQNTLLQRQVSRLAQELAIVNYRSEYGDSKKHDLASDSSEQSE
ncbi:MAG: DUF2304 domain-containing protein [Candidatus Latescibacteria bacterium]|jgi:hypothetical protein|nr:DUF2304 domain-containing protein [Candidatus Latescibacterota bacterium]